MSPETFRFHLNHDKLRRCRRREGRYLLRSNLTEQDPAHVWEKYLLLTQVEQAFKELKGDMSVRPIYHQKEARMSVCDLTQSPQALSGWVDFTQRF